jgi:hypothetical protein
VGVKGRDRSRGRVREARPTRSRGCARSCGIGGEAARYRLCSARRGAERDGGTGPSGPGAGGLGLGAWVRATGVGSFRGWCATVEVAAVAAARTGPRGCRSGGRMGVAVVGRVGGCRGQGRPKGGRRVGEGR